MRRYELLFITDPDLADEDKDAAIKRITDLVEGGQGYIARLDEWGKRRLAYLIKKKNRGYYTLLDFCGDGPMVSEMERVMRIDERFMRYLTVLVDSDVKLDDLKAEIAAQEEEERKRAEEAAKRAEEARAAAEAAAARAAAAEAAAAAAAAEKAQADTDDAEAEPEPEPEAEDATESAPEVEDATEPADEAPEEDSQEDNPPAKEEQEA